MYEERHWGEYKIIHNVQYSDGFQSLTKQLIIKAGKSLTYQAHHLRKEVWTVVDGEGLLAIEGKLPQLNREILFVSFKICATV